MATAIFIRLTEKRLEIKRNNRQSSPAKAVIKMKYDDVERISCLNLIKTSRYPFRRFRCSVLDDNNKVEGLKHSWKKRQTFSFKSHSCVAFLRH